MKSFRYPLTASAITLAAGCVGLTSAHASTYSNIHFFGDSISDSGNVALALGYPSGVPRAVSGNGAIPEYPYAASGRFSNRPVWAGDFAASGLAAAPSLAGGNDFAFTGERPRGADMPVVDGSSRFDNGRLGTHGTVTKLVAG